MAATTVSATKITILSGLSNIVCVSLHGITFCEVTQTFGKETMCTHTCVCTYVCVGCVFVLYIIESACRRMSYHQWIGNI